MLSDYSREDMDLLEIDDVDEDEVDRTPRPKRGKTRALKRALCPNCRMLLSVFETRTGKCRTCHAEVGAIRN